MTRPFSKILIVDVGGTPRAWVTYKTAVLYAIKECIAWIPPTATKATILGGHNHDGDQSQVEIASIMAIKGPMLAKVLANSKKIPRVTNKVLFARDRYRCAYCGEKFHEAALTRDHIIPKKAGGKNTWTNLISACKPCNSRKADRLPSIAGMPLKFKPYVPSKLEHLNLTNNRLTNDQHEYLDDFAR